MHYHARVDGQVTKQNGEAQITTHKGRVVVPYEQVILTQLKKLTVLLQVTTACRSFFSFLVCFICNGLSKASRLQITFQLCGFSQSIKSILRSPSA